MQRVYVHRMMSHNLWGGQNHNKFGNKVIKRHFSMCQRYEPSHGKHVLLGVVFNELRLRNESKVYQYEEHWFAAVSCVCIRDRHRVVGHLQRRMKRVNHQRINVMDRMELVEETFLRGIMNNGDVIQV